jgi:lipoate-protein ligase A
MAESIWFILNSGAGQPAENMACDEALLEAASLLARPALRCYGWLQPAATFGYFQRYAEVSILTSLRPLIRRPTGGGLVPHDHDWTYSVAIPPSDPWYELKAAESYRRVHEWVRAAFAELGVPTSLSPCCIPEGPGQCFIGAEPFDLLHNGSKIAGAAQRRRKDGLLIQGSIQAGKLGLLRSSFEAAFRAAATAQWGISWQEFSVSPEFLQRRQQLTSEKYSRPEYNERR